MTNNLPPETVEYTPEQRKLLGKAYRLILSWPREKSVVPVSPNVAESLQSRKVTVRPSENVILSLKEKQR